MLLIGAMIGVVGYCRPPYLAILLPILVSTRGRHGRRARGLLLSATAVVFLLAAAVNLRATGSWTAYGGERRGFMSYTGYPLVDFPADGWQDQVDRFGNTSWTRSDALAPEFDARLLLWNSFYFVTGRNVGLLACFLPAALMLFSARAPGRWSFICAILLAVTWFLLWRPFNFYGGAG